MNAAWGLFVEPGGGSVRWATGTPTSMKNSSWLPGDEDRAGITDHAEMWERVIRIWAHAGKRPAWIVSRNRAWVQRAEDRVFGHLASSGSSCEYIGLGEHFDATKLQAYPPGPWSRCPRIPLTSTGRDQANTLRRYRRSDRSASTMWIRLMTHKAPELELLEA